jgi:proton glutamate symport protein
MNLSTSILAALGLGAVFGTILTTLLPGVVGPLDQYLLSPIGDAFLRLIQFAVVPIVFSSLVLGLTGMQSADKAGRYILKLMVIYLVTGFVALCLGMGLALVMQPGAGVEGFTMPTVASNQAAPDLLKWLVELIPVNPMAALSSGNLIQIILSAVLFSIGIQLTPVKSRPFVALIESIYEVGEKILSVILYAAPVGVFALISSVIATQGLELISRLLFYVLGLLIATTIMILFYILVLFCLQAKPVKLIQNIVPSLSLAFGTASSNAVLPVLLKNLQEDYGLREEITSFAIPLGTAIKRDGSAVLQSFNALFIAQVYHVPMTPYLLLSIGLSSLLVSFSTPGIPGSALITMATVLTAAGLPVEGIALVAGIDRLTDGFKTVLNVIGNSSTAILLSYWESAAGEEQEIVIAEPVVLPVIESSHEKRQAS